MKAIQFTGWEPENTARPRAQQALAAVTTALRETDAAEHAQLCRDLAELALLAFAYTRGTVAGAELAYALGDDLACAGVMQ